TAILANADPTDADGDGISGRPNLVPAASFVPVTETGGGTGLHVGRFGLKANTSSLLEQTVNAYLQDIGITSEFAPIEGAHPSGNGISIGDRVGDPELSAAKVLQTVMYLRLLAPPARGKITPQVTQGEGIFTAIGCAKCHIPTLRTGPNAIPQLANKDVNLYSDLLLHDMGPDLADNRPDHQANGTEWKTRPLWGLRLVPEFLGGQPNYLHDARTSDLRTAIVLHGGEAETSRNAFNGLTETEKAALVAFLNSL
ncbi:MAG: thiol oxidoreductase, partial [candidate division Zixibacteria bacterium]|nr:thiol oxidoreductase [candidate division Zixibacteria bacterium]